MKFPQRRCGCRFGNSDDHHHHHHHHHHHRQHDKQNKTEPHNEYRNKSKHPDNDHKKKQGSCECVFCKANAQPHAAHQQRMQQKKASLLYTPLPSSARHHAYTQKPQSSHGPCACAHCSGYSRGKKQASEPSAAASGVNKHRASSSSSSSSSPATKKPCLPVEKKNKKHQPSPVAHRAVPKKTTVEEEEEEPQRRHHHHHHHRRGHRRRHHDDDDDDEKHACKDGCFDVVIINQGPCNMDAPTSTNTTASCRCDILRATLLALSVTPSPTPTQISSAVSLATGYVQCRTSGGTVSPVPPDAAVVQAWVAAQTASPSVVASAALQSAICALNAFCTTCPCPSPCGPCNVISASPCNPCVPACCGCAIRNAGIVQEDGDDDSDEDSDEDHDDCACGHFGCRCLCQQPCCPQQPCPFLVPCGGCFGNNGFVA